MRPKGDKKIKEIEDMFEEWNGSQGQGFSIEESKKNLMELEKHGRKILNYIEVGWRLKNKALWLLEKGDENTKFFHHFSNHRKN